MTPGYMAAVEHFFPLTSRADWGTVVRNGLVSPSYRGGGNWATAHVTGNTHVTREPLTVVRPTSVNNKGGLLLLHDYFSCSFIAPLPC